MSVLLEYLRRALVYPVKLIRCMTMSEAIKYLLACVRREALVRIRPRGYDLWVVIRPGTTDIRVFYELFGLREMDFVWPLQHAPRTIIDAGANIGYATIAIKAKWPQATVLAIEPDPENFRILTENCRDLGDVRLTQNGLWGKHCNLKVTAASHSKGAWALSFFPVTSEAGGIPAITVLDAIRMLGEGHCDFLKIDIEGAEESILSSNVESWIEKISVILIEVHGEKNRNLLSEMVLKYGFMIRQVGEKHLLWRSNGC